MSSRAIFDENLSLQVAAPPRRLGGVFAPARMAHLLYLPLFMSLVGLVCWVVETDVMLMVGSVSLGLVAVYLFYGLTVQQKPLRITTLLVATLGLAYGLGSANSWFTVPRSGTGLGEFLHKDPVALTHTMGSLLFAMAIVLAVGEYAERPIFGEDFELNLPPQAIFFITIGVTTILVAFARGSLNFMGASVGAGGNLGVFASFAGWLVSTLFALTLVAALNAKSKALKRYLLLLTLVQFVLVIPLGRRVMIYTMVLALIALRLGRFRFNWAWPKRILVGILLAGTLYATSIAFFYLRLAGFASGKTHLGLIERVTLAYTYFENKDFDEVQKSFSKNVQGRTFILGFLAELEEYTAHFTPGYGRDLQGQFLVAVPSVLYPSKNRNFEEEGLANELFGTAYIDEANSILTGGMIDFGVLGLVLYPLLLSLMMRSFFEFIGQTLPTFVATFIIFAALGGLLQPENALTDYFILIRNGLLFGSVVWFFIALPAFRLRKEG